MAEDDDDRPSGQADEKPADLDILSIEELEDRIVALQAEIDLYRLVIEKKKQARGAADGVFRS